MTENGILNDMAFYGEVRLDPCGSSNIREDLRLIGATLPLTGSHPSTTFTGVACLD